ncbi:hypothetical protein F2Q68_00012667 [Brassica cretica]|uniref:Uncharacterized protein n=1 Tax=Brassica cretica TaxID=69181 RepID=A0A8S9HIX4_BRACR|nr:hypothetical protein F2Q68_00012667 [Brassica cretica]
MLEQPSLDLNLACQEYSVDPTAMRVGSDDGGNNHNATSPDSWLKLARGRKLTDYPPETYGPYPGHSPVPVPVPTRYFCPP